MFKVYSSVILISKAWWPISKTGTAALSRDWHVHNLHSHRGKASLERCSCAGGSVQGKHCVIAELACHRGDLAIGRRCIPASKLSSVQRLHDKPVEQCCRPRQQSGAVNLA